MNPLVQQWRICACGTCLIGGVNMDYISKLKTLEAKRKRTIRNIHADYVAHEITLARSRSLIRDVNARYYREMARIVTQKIVETEMAS